MKKHLLTVFFAVIISVVTSVSFAKKEGDGGDLVRNGGGLSEQALLYSSLHYRSFAERCLQNSACSSEKALQMALKKVQSCTLPESKDFSFAMPKENASLKGKIYVANAGKFVINREELYRPAALRFPTAIAFLSRVYMDHCQALSWKDSVNIVAPLVTLAEYDGEQITVGKDSIRLPQPEWIRVRSLFSDLLIETPTEIISLSCRHQNVDDCGVTDISKEVASEDRFKYLSLANEEIVNGKVVFLVEGHYQPKQKAAEFFDLKVETVKGKILSIEWLGSPVPLPKN